MTKHWHIYCPLQNVRIPRLAKKLDPLTPSQAFPPRNPFLLSLLRSISPSPSASSSHSSYLLPLPFPSIDTMLPSSKQVPPSKFWVIFISFLKCSIGAGSFGLPKAMSKCESLSPHSPPSPLSPLTPSSLSTPSWVCCWNNGNGVNGRCVFPHDGPHASLQEDNPGISPSLEPPLYLPPI